MAQDVQAVTLSKQGAADGAACRSADSATQESHAGEAMYRQAEAHTHEE